MRIGIVHNPEDVSEARRKGSISRTVQGALWALPEAQAKQFVTKLVKEEFVSKLKAKEITIDDLAVHVC